MRMTTCCFPPLIPPDVDNAGNIVQQLTVDCRRAPGASYPDDLALDHVHDVRGMVRDALQVFPDEGQADGPCNGAGVFDHEGQQLAKQLVRGLSTKSSSAHTFRAWAESERAKASRDSRTISMVQFAIRGMSI
jgi:hypothetical protein